MGVVEVVVISFDQAFPKALLCLTVALGILYIH